MEPGQRGPALRPPPLPRLHRRLRLLLRRRRPQRPQADQLHRPRRPRPGGRQGIQHQQRRLCHSRPVPVPEAVRPVEDARAQGAGVSFAAPDEEPAIPHANTRDCLETFGSPDAAHKTQLSVAMYIFCPYARKKRPVTSRTSLSSEPLASAGASSCFGVPSRTSPNEGYSSPYCDLK